MSQVTKENILDVISEMTVLEISELVKAMEEKFGVSAAAPVAVAAAGAPGAGGGAADAGGDSGEAATVSVILKEADASKKIPVIKEVRALTGLGLKDAKDLVEAGGKTVKENISSDEANKIKEKLEAAGAVVEIK